MQLLWVARERARSADESCPAASESQRSTLRSAQLHHPPSVASIHRLQSAFHSPLRSLSELIGWTLLGVRSLSCRTSLYLRRLLKAALILGGLAKLPFPQADFPALQGDIQMRPCCRPSQVRRRWERSAWRGGDSRTVTGRDRRRSSSAHRLTPSHRRRSYPGFHSSLLSPGK